MSEVILSLDAIETIMEEGEKNFPNEACGFLYGTEKNQRIIKKAIPVINSKEGDQKRRFAISAFDYMKAERYALDNDIQLLGIYHSHPDHPAIASEHDLKVAMPYFSYVIVSVLKGKADKVMSWKLKEEKREFQEEKVLINATNLIY
ncbi:MAG: proteasome lid subunit RPN8/RPN11 [Maribacter sp.]|jgi:proteasome lid subunit RPN8/RPN11